jgi:DNA repair exonuclease SbcCD nuclease subunit
MSKRNIFLYVIRGNHDDPKFFNGDYYYPNLQLLKDYSILHFNGINILLVGGAVSIDRKIRMIGRDYWIDESFVLDEEKLSYIDKKIDVVITHNAPSEVTPIGFNSLVYHYAKNDPLLLGELTKERNLISKMCDTLLFKGHPIQQWFYGHFHQSSTEEYKGIKFTLLGISEFKELKL